MHHGRELAKVQLSDAFKIKPREKRWSVTCMDQSCPSPDMNWINLMDIFCPQFPTI